jgi:hypothetical protein
MPRASEGSQAVGKQQLFQFQECPKAAREGSFVFHIDR